MMKTFSPMQQAILQELSHSRAISGTALGEKLAVSRTAIWKQIKLLQGMGLAIKSEAQQGYLLEKPFIMLKEEEIRQALSEQQFPADTALDIFSEIDSTNRYLKDKALDSAKISCCIAESQSQGRGRFQRVWISPFGDNIYFSARWKLDCELSRLGGLSLVVSLAIVGFLQSLGLGDELCIKWPNDILWQGKKLCGNLIEIIAETNSQVMPIIGIGLNVNADKTSMQAVDKPCTSLYEMTGRYFNRNQLIAGLINFLDQYLTAFMQRGFQAFIKQWQSLDYLAGKEIEIDQATTKLKGLACGVSDNGCLLLKDNTGNIQQISSGEASLHLYKTSK